MIYPIHPAAEIFPRMDDAEIARLAADIREYGLKEPVRVYRGRILDGRNRLAACKHAGVEPEYRHVTDEEVGPSPTRYVLSLNLERRHLNATQLALLTQRLLPAFADEARERMLAGKSDTDDPRDESTLGLQDDSQRALVQAAAAAGAGISAAKTLRRVIAQAPELEPVAAAGYVSVSDLDRLSRLEPAARSEVLAEIDSTHPMHGAKVKDAGKTPRAAIRKAVQRAVSANAVAAAAGYVANNSIQILRADCLETIRSLTDGSVSLLLTDPPYAVTDNDWDTFESPEAYWAFMRTWLTAMRPKMATAFHAFVFCDATLTVPMHNVLAETGWPVLRQAIWHKPNLAKKRSGSLTFMSAYEPFWHCGNHTLRFPETWGDERFDVQSVTNPQSNHVSDPAVHPTQKPLALFRRLVALGAAPGELVVDPFCGAGTTALACSLEARRCVTGDTSAEYVAIAKGRIAEEVIRAA